jgi:putative transcriptional regulator
MKKRNGFDELVQGFEELKAEREGRLTLCSAEVEALLPVTIAPQEIVEIRERLKMSQPVFAARLRINTRTLQGWERGAAFPGSAAATLIQLVRKSPQILDDVAGL